MLIGQSHLKLFKVSICLLLMVSLQACEKRIPQRLSLMEASRSYNLGDHERAFRITEALAYEGDSKAQYALGYLYFYGIGTPQNRALGIALIEQSAKNGYEKAKIAYQQINGASMSIGEAHSNPVNLLGANSPDPVNASEMIEKTNNAQEDHTVKPELSNQLAESAMDSLTIIANNKITENNSIVLPNKDNSIEFQESASKDPTGGAVDNQEAYTIQLLGSNEITWINDVIQKFDLKDKTHMYKKSIHGKDWWMLVIGQYPTFQAASMALEELPTALKANNNPWVRSIKSIENEIAVNNG